MNPSVELDSIWAIAEARMTAGEPPLRHIGLAYSMSPGDGDIGALAWMSEAESERAHALQMELQRQQKVLDAGAADRIRAKIAARRMRLT